MLGNKRAVATVAVRDSAAGRRFYEGTLGLAVEHTEGDEAISVPRRGRPAPRLQVRGTPGSNLATAVNWPVGDELDAIVRGLHEKGVAFEHYDLPGLTRQGDVHVAGPHPGGLVQGPRREHPFTHESVARPAFRFAGRPPPGAW